MKEPSVFYRAMDPQKGSWDGFGCFVQNDSDFLAYVADAPSGASIQTPELIRAFWTENLRNAPFSGDPALGCVELADSINRLQDFLRRKSRSDAALYQSTLCVARKSGRRLFYASIGDSCMFLLRKGTGTPFTAWIPRKPGTAPWSRGEEDQGTPENRSHPFRRCRRRLCGSFRGADVGSESGRAIGSGNGWCLRCFESRGFAEACAVRRTTFEVSSIDLSARIEFPMM